MIFVYKKNIKINIIFSWSVKISHFHKVSVVYSSNIL